MERKKILIDFEEYENILSLETTRNKGLSEINEVLKQQNKELKKDKMLKLVIIKKDVSGFFNPVRFLSEVDLLRDELKQIATASNFISKTELEEFLREETLSKFNEFSKIIDNKVEELGIIKKTWWYKIFYFSLKKQRVEEK